ncbi:Crp/Fnr family transcriptional regulator [Bariatricus sp. SGI.154]|uniref:Crp/Fnr family transcriptional regulator n=1 Tax=Bariatricus sp. SGI.154 TaxID=3420549 RepID=UPI003D07C1D7
MKINIDMLSASPLFQGIKEEDLENMLSCLGGTVRNYGRNEVILVEGEPVGKVGVVLKGCVQVMNEDVFGNRTILEQVGQGELFGAAYACAKFDRSPVSVAAVEDSAVLQLDVRRVLTVCPTACQFHQELVRNMVHILAGKNVLLGEKIRYLSRRTTREKLMSYLSDQSKRAGSRHFCIPFDRQGLADYLCVERSAMSAELGKLRKEGVVDYLRSEFWLK